MRRLRMPLARLAATAGTGMVAPHARGRRACAAAGLIAKDVLRRVGARNDSRPSTHGLLIDDSGSVATAHGNAAVRLHRHAELLQPPVGLVVHHELCAHRCSAPFDTAAGLVVAERAAVDVTRRE